MVVEPLTVLCESYEIKEQLGEDGSEPQVFMEGIAITFNKPTRNRVSYTYQSGLDKHKTLIGKPFLDTHNDTSIHTHPPYGHVVEARPGKNPKNGLPCLFYKVDIDPEEKAFIRKAKRGDIAGASIQVLVDDVKEKKDDFGNFIEANIREYLELSAVLIPGDGDTSVMFAEKFLKREDVNTTSAAGLITPDGVFPTKKVLKTDKLPEQTAGRELTPEEIEEEKKKKPLQPLDADMLISKEGETKEQIYQIKKPKRKLSKPSDYRFKGKRETMVASKGLNCPSCSERMLYDRFSGGESQLRCYSCQFTIVGDKYWKEVVDEARERLGG